MLFIPLWLMLLPGDSLFAQDVIPTKGKDFWMGFMQNYSIDNQEYLSLYITSEQNTTGTVSVPLQGWEEDITVLANQTTEVLIPNNIAEHFGTSEVIEDRGVRIETADTVAVFAINFNPFTADGSKILPVKTLGTRYRVSSYSGIGGNPSEMLIVATEDDTEVEIIPSVDTEGGNAAGVPFIVQLDQGQSYQVKSAGGDLTGSLIQATEASGECRPFAVFGGVMCANIPTNCTACDHIFDQSFPTETWGTRFFAAPFEGPSSYTYRILADEDNTQVTVNGGPPIALNGGEFYEENLVEDAICVESDKPISVIQYMQGTTCSDTGDPAMLILNDDSQKIDNITFTPIVNNLDVLEDHYINVIIETVDIGSLSLNGTFLDPAIFTQFPNCPSHSWAQIQIPEESQTMEAPNGFSAYVYGFGEAESYTYSVGSFSRGDVLNIVDGAACANDSITLEIQADVFDVNWYLQSDPETILGTGPQLFLTAPIAQGIYVAQGAQFISGCEIEELYSVEVPEPPLVSASPENPTICKYQEVQMNVSATPNSDNYVYSWSPDYGISNTSIPNPVLSPLQTTTYTYTVSTLSGCGTASGTVTVVVEDGDISALNAGTDVDQFCIGGSAQLEASIFTVEVEDDFDPGISWGTWDDISNGEALADCGSNNGLALYFNGNGERSATTIDLDLTEGGEISFSLKVGAELFPCDDAEIGDDIVLEYSINGGADWILIETYFEFAYPDFTSLSTVVPEGAETASTRIRWRQLANGGAGQDNWALDDVFVGVPDNDSFDFSWTPEGIMDDANVSNPEASPSESGWVYVNVEDISGCTYVDSLFFDVGQEFDLDITPDTVLCDLQGVQLSLEPSIEGDYEFLWSPNDGSISNVNVQEPLVSPVETTTYSIEVNSVQGCSNNADVTITVNELLDLEVTTDNNDFCAGEEASLSAEVEGNSNDLSYEWSPADFLSDSEIPDPITQPDQPIIYTVTVTDNESGCILTESIEINAFEAFELELVSDTSVCNAQGLELLAEASITGLLDWNWEPAAELIDWQTPSPELINNSSNQFTVTATDEGGCSVSDTVNVEVLFQGFSLGDDLDLCEGDTLLLESGFGDSFEHLWSTAETSSSINVTDGGNYSVTVTSEAGCESTDAINVVIRALPELDLGEDQDLCVGDSYVLDASNIGAEFEWNTGETTQAILVDTSGTYSVTVTDIWECSSTDESEVIFHDFPLIELPDSSMSCIDESLSLDAGSDGLDYLWSTGETSREITVDLSGMYWVEVTSEFNCSSLDTTIYTQVDYPDVDLGTDQAFCADIVVTLDAGNPGATYNWSTGDTTQTISTSFTGDYTVSVSNGYCISVDQVTLFAYPLPNDPFPADTSICVLESENDGQLDALNPGSSYLWNTGSTERFLTELTTATYWVEITTAFGCSYSDTINVVDFCPSDQIYIPTAFSPNDDGINDVFYAQGPNVVAFEIQIYNRWGQEVFSADDINQPWLGNMKGGDHFGESEVYVYQIRYKYLEDSSGTVSDWKKKRGHVTLLR